MKVPFARLRTLDPEVLEELRSRVQDGATSSEVSGWLRGLGKFQDVSETALQRQVDRYREYVLTEPASASEPPTTPYALDPRAEMEKVVRQLRARVERAEAMEKTLPMPLAATTKLYDQYSNALEKLARMTAAPKAPQEYQAPDDLEARFERAQRALDLLAASDSEDSVELAYDGSLIQ